MKALNSVERLWMTNGRALLSALFHRKYQFRQHEHRLDRLVAMYASGVLPMADVSDELDRKLHASRLVCRAVEKSVVPDPAGGQYHRDGCQPLGGRCYLS